MTNVIQRPNLVQCHYCPVIIILVFLQGSKLTLDHRPEARDFNVRLVSSKWDKHSSLMYTIMSL